MPVVQQKRPDSPPRPPAPRHAGLVLGGLLFTVAAVVAAVAIALYQPGDSTPSATPPPASVPRLVKPHAVAGIPQVKSSLPGFPAPPQGAVVYARQDRSDAIALAVVRRSPLVVQASVVGPDGTGAKGLDVRFRAGSTTMRGQACGHGCYWARLTAAKPSSITVSVAHPNRTTRWTVQLPKTFPPPSAAALMRRASKAFHDLHAVTFEERLASSPRAVINTRWRLDSPDRLAYQIHGGAAGVQIGARRWDRPAGGKWVASEATRLPQPSPQWASVTDAHILGRTTVRGRPAYDVSFFDAQTPAWFRGKIDARTNLVLDLTMVATAHFMHDVYGPFNGPSRIVPPVS
jgi:hypothetical protein